MTEIDQFMVNKLIDSEFEPISQIGWRLYNRKKPMNIEELNEIGALIVTAFGDAENFDVEAIKEESFEAGRDEGYSDGKDYGYDDGYDDGYAKGYQDGLDEGKSGEE
jgi:flagellar biosynthesis/type III secretory pathway protein FliH